GISEPGCVTNSIVALVIKYFGGFFGLLEIPWSDDRPLDTNLELVATGNELDGNARHRQADYARAIGLVVAVCCQRRGFRRAPGRNHGNGMPELLPRKLDQAVPKVLGQRSRSVKDHLQIREKMAAQFGVGAKHRQ